MKRAYAAYFGIQATLVAARWVILAEYPAFRAHFRPPDAPYRYVQSPMAMASLLQGAAVGVVLGSSLVLAYALAGALIWNFVARPWEERDLEARFGAHSRAYGRHVRCWIPRVSPYEPERAIVEAIVDVRP